MARGRIISKTIPSSKKMALLSCDSARLTYLYLYTQVDDEGRIEGDSFLLRSFLFPRDEIKTKEDVEKWLQEMHDVGLIIRYYDKSCRDWFIQIPDFREYNWIRSDRFKESKFPAPPRELLEKVLEENDSNGNGGRQLVDQMTARCQSNGNQQSANCHSQFNGNLSESNLSKDNSHRKNNVAIQNKIDRIYNGLKEKDMKVYVTIKNCIQMFAEKNKTKKISVERELKLIQELVEIYESRKFSFDGEEYQVTVPLFLQGLKTITVKGIDCINYARKIWVSAIEREKKIGGKQLPKEYKGVPPELTGGF